MPKDCDDNNHSDALYFLKMFKLACKETIKL